MNNTEKQLKKLENEVDALKVAFEQSAVSMPIFSQSVDLVTQQNLLNYEFTYGGQTLKYSMYANERVEVTFTTSRGSNTIATLEINADNIKCSPRIQRVPYSGGAKWIVVGQPNVVYPNWYATEYTFTVHSMVDGYLTAENMTS